MAITARTATKATPPNNGARRKPAGFVASDLTSGNAAKGLSGGVGSPAGNVRLELDTELDIVHAAYVRAPDGTLSAMHDTVRRNASPGGGYEYLAPVFNLSTEMEQASSLRLINPGAEAALVSIEGRDDNGAAGIGAVELAQAGGAAATITAQQLEAGDVGLTGRLGTGTGKWRLTVSSDRAIRVLNVVSSSSGHTNNLSTAAADGDPDGADDGVGIAAYRVGQALPGVSASGAFDTNLVGGGRVVTAGDGRLLEMDGGAYFELDGDTLYTCVSPDGCAVMNGTVTRGTVLGRAAGSGGGGADAFPTFRTATPPGGRTFEAGVAIATLTLPAATGGDGPLTYSLCRCGGRTQFGALPSVSDRRIHTHPPQRQV